MLQSAVSRISLVVTPRFFAADTEAPLVECALKIDVSIPDRSKTVLSHLAIEDDVTEWYGLIHEIKSFDCLSVFSGERRSSVLLMYWLTVATGQIESSSVNLLNDISFVTFPGLDCLVNPVGIKDIPSWLVRRWFTLKRQRSADLDGLVKANNIAVFKVRDLSGKDPLGASDFK